jgi:hypothetical protein
MQSPQEQPAAGSASHHIAQSAAPHSDFIASLIWIAFGVAVALGSWRMDRLENQDVNPLHDTRACCGPARHRADFLGCCCSCAVAARRARAGFPCRRVDGQRAFGSCSGLCLTFSVGLVDQ